MARKKTGGAGKKTNPKPHNPKLGVHDDDIEVYSDDDLTDDESDHDDDEFKNLYALKDSLDSLEYAKRQLEGLPGDHTQTIATLDSMIRDLEVKIAESEGCDLDAQDHDDELDSVPPIGDDESVWEGVEDDGTTVELMSDDEEEEQEEEEDETLTATATAASLTTEEAIAASARKAAPKTKPAAPVFTPIIPTKFAPKKATVGGEYSIGCINIEWTNFKGVGAQAAGNMGKQIKNHYASLSGNALKYTPVGMSFKVPYPRAAKNVNKAAQMVMSKANAKRKSQGLKPFDQFAIIHGGARKYSNAGRNTIYMVNTLTRTALHEKGHSHPTRLGHAGKYADQGKGKLEPYGDRGTFMGKFSSVVLNGPEMWAEGWLPKEKVAQFDYADKSVDLDMEYIYSKQAGSAVKGVLIPSRVGGRDLFLSNFNRKGKNYLALYYLTSEGRGTQQIGVFNKDFEWDGLKIERLATSGSTARIRISAPAA